MRKRLLQILGILIALPILYIVGVFALAYFTDYQPAPQTPLTYQKKGLPIITQDTLSFMTWNIGFCGMGKEMDFFYDGGQTMRNPQSVVEKNLAGVLRTISDSLDFVLIQEIDSASKRSYHLNQIQALREDLPKHTGIFGKNYDVRFVPKPFLDPMGDVLGGILTMSKYYPQTATQYAYKSKYHFPDYLFYLDRCFTVARFPTSHQGKELVVINAHNSAYDPKGDLKAIELAQLKTVMLEEYAKGNYVVVGADWNQYPPDYKGVGKYGKENQYPQACVSKDFPDKGWQWVWDAQTPTNRHSGKPFHADSTHRSIIDFFLISPNVLPISVQGQDIGFDYSDHQPVRMKIKLQ